MALVGLRADQALARQPREGLAHHADADNIESSIQKILAMMNRFHQAVVSAIGIVGEGKIFSGFVEMQRAIRNSHCEIRLS